MLRYLNCRKEYQKEKMRNYKSKSEARNPKSEINSKFEFRIFTNFDIRISYLILMILFSFTPAYSANLDELKNNFLKGDYTLAIKEGERLLSESHNDEGLDELYYFLGLSYLKDGNYLRASDIFEIIINEYPKSVYKFEAELGLADTYFLRADFNEAMRRYERLLSGAGTKKDFTPLIYKRIAELSVKSGNTQKAQEYKGKLAKEYPETLKQLDNQELLLSNDIFYTVQVGAFSSQANAQRLKDKLALKGYDAYVEELTSGSKVSYRVRIGKYKDRTQAIENKEKLSSEGYPTKIFP